MTTITVVVATYRRPDALRRCLRSLASQERPADEVVVVVRADDRATLVLLDEPGLRVRRVAVAQPGVVAALEAAVAAAAGDVVAFTDDDAVPRADWLRRIEAHMTAGADVAGVGGRDWCWFDGQLVSGATADVGRMQWFGRVTSGHHLGIGPAREVATLKGVNMAFRRGVLREVGFDRRLRGDGAQVHFELALGLGARRLGWRVIYDPAIAVDHYPARRFGEDQRGAPSLLATEHATHNETLAVLEHLTPPRRWAFGVWALAVGTRSKPGVAASIRRLVSGVPALGLFRSAQRGRLAGWRTYRGGRRSSRPPRIR